MNAEVMRGHNSPTTHTSHTRTETFVWDHATGWIFWQTSDGTPPLPLCWIPVERRGHTFACHGTTVVLGAVQGIITILDFEDVIADLSNANQALLT
jgi:hypothetical protein